MGQPRLPGTVLLFCGLIASSEARIHQAIKPLVKRFGPVADRSPILDWNYSQYYEKELGKDLIRQFLFFEERISPDRIAPIKRETIRVEEKLSEAPDGRRRRTVNIDPGYLTPAKVVLTTTKEFSHRIYLMEGIYAEATLLFEKGTFVSLRHTYPDFRSNEYIDLFNRVRNRLLMGSP